MTSRKTLTPAELQALFAKTEQSIVDASAVRADVAERLGEHLSLSPLDEPTEEDRLRRQRIAEGRPVAIES